MIGLRRIGWLAVALVLVGAAGAKGPSSSPRPAPRPGPDRVVEVIDLSHAPVSREARLGLRPPARPVPATQRAQGAPTGPQSPRPRPRPGPVTLIQTRIVTPPPAVPVRPVDPTPAIARPTTPRTGEAIGPVCADTALLGRDLPRIRGELAGCAIDAPVEVHSVNGITLSQPAILHCDAARALRRWVDRGVSPAIGRLGGGLAELRVAAHYVCRTRNNLPGAKLSEHAKGRAIDISAFQLANGVEVTVLDGWQDRRHSALLKKIHMTACGPFKTVLGPEADRFHLDHIHLDAAQRRSAYCR